MTPGPFALGRPERLSDQVAGAMLEAILSEDLRPGDQLPSERALGEQFGVSRTVVREAVRALIARGVVASAPGRGLTVTAVGADAVSSALSLYLRGREPVDYEQVHDVRRLLEVRIAGLAAEHGSDAETAELRAICQRLRDAGTDLEARVAEDLAFHRALGRMTHNDLYAIVLDALLVVAHASWQATVGRITVLGDVHEAHRMILERVAAHDAEGARSAMRVHLDQTLAEVRSIRGRCPTVG